MLVMESRRIYIAVCPGSAKNFTGSQWPSAGLWITNEVYPDLLPSFLFFALLQEIHKKHVGERCFFPCSREDFLIQGVKEWWNHVGKLVFPQKAEPAAQHCRLVLWPFSLFYFQCRFLWSITTLKVFFTSVFFMEAREGKNKLGCISSDFISGSEKIPQNVLRIISVYTLEV